MQYEIYIVINNKWKLYYQNTDIKQIDSAIRNLIEIRPNKPIQIIVDDKLLTILDGTEWQYKYWTDNYINGKKLIKLK